MLAGRGRAGSVALFLVLAVLILVRGDDGGGPGGGFGDRGGGSPEGVDAEPGSELDGDVLRAVDGDTILVSINGDETRVRYIGVDTPESVKPDTPVECFAKEAAAFNRELVEGERVALVIGREPFDRFGRLLAYVSVAGTEVNAELLRGGYARTLEIPPNTSRANAYRQLELEAGRSGAGLWGAGC